MSANSNIEHRRTVHGGDDSALSVEISPVRFSSITGEAMTEYDQPDRVQGFGVYIRNPLAFHVQDFGPESVDPDRRVTLDEAKAAAFKYADGLADHLGCSVESHVRRPAAAFPFRAEFEALGFALEGGGAAPTFYCHSKPGGDVRVTSTAGDAEGISATDWLIGVYIGDDGPEFFTRDLAFDFTAGANGPDMLTLAAAAAAFVDALPEPATPGQGDDAPDYWPCPMPFEVYSDGIAQQHYLARFTAGYVVFSSLSGCDFPREGDWMIAAGWGDVDEEDTSRPPREFARIKGTDGADVQTVLDTLLKVVESAAD